MKNKNEESKKIILLETLPICSDLPRRPRKGRFLCFCGREFVTTLYNVKCGNTKSCGHNIVKRPKIIKPKRTPKGRTRLNNILRGIQQRCYNHKRVIYPYYGGRGIKICEEWRKDPLAFDKWAMENGYNDTLTIDRIDNSKDYCPENCRWVSRKVQSANRGFKKRNIGLVGVYIRSNGKFTASICINCKLKHLGTFSTPEEASVAYQKAKKERDEMYLKEEGLI